MDCELKKKDKADDKRVKNPDSIRMKINLNKIQHSGLTTVEIKRKKKIEKKKHLHMLKRHNLNWFYVW